jgi:hypothetical protein
MMVLIVVAGSCTASLGLVPVHVEVGGFTPGGFLVIGPLMVLYGFFATRVSLPWYYVLLFLVPLVGIYAFWKISWRVSFLPWRDWDLRPGEPTSDHDLRWSALPHRQAMVHVRLD